MPTIDELNALFLSQEEEELYTPEPASQTADPVIAELNKQFSRQPYETPEFQPEPPTLWESVGRGAADITEGIQQGWYWLTDDDMLDKFNKQTSEDHALYERGRGPDAGMDWMRMAGNMAATAPVALVPGGASAALGTRLASGATQGALASGLMFTEPGDSKLSQTAMGAAGGAAVPAVMSALAKPAAAVAQGTSSLLNKVRRLGIDVDALLTDAGLETSDRMRQAAALQLKKTGEFDPETLKRLAQAESLGFTGDFAPTTGQVTRAPKQWTRERNWQKLDELGDDITGRFQNQDQRFLDVTEEMVPQGNLAGSPFEASEAAWDATMSTWKQSQEAVGKLYKDAEALHGQKGANLGSFWEEMQPFMDDATLDPITTSITRTLRRQGIIDGDGELTGELLPLKRAEQIRKFIGQISDKNEPALKRAKGMLVDRFDDSVIDSLGDDFYSSARDAARSRFKMFESKLLNDIVAKGKQPDKLFDDMTRASVKDLTGMKELLKTTSEGTQAWDEMRGQVVQQLAGKATAMKPGRAPWSGAAFSRELDKIGPQRLKIMFDPEDVQKLNTIRDVGLDLTYAPPYSAVNHSNTAPVFYRMLKSMKISDTLSQYGAKKAQAAEIRNALAGSPVDRRTSQDRYDDLYQSLLAGFRGRTGGIGGVLGNYATPAAEDILENITQ